MQTNLSLFACPKKFTFTRHTLPQLFGHRRRKNGFRISTSAIRSVWSSVPAAKQYNSCPTTATGKIKLSNLNNSVLAVAKVENYKQAVDRERASIIDSLIPHVL